MAPKVKAQQFRERTADGTLRLHLHAGQERAWFSKARFIAVQAGTQSGKTVMGPIWLHREMDELGAGDYLAVTATYPLLDKKMLVELTREFIVDFDKWGTYKAASRVFESHERDHGGPAYRIIVTSAQNPESLESATAKAAWLDEVGQDQFKREAWEAVLRRLSLAQGRCLMTTSLYSFGWYKLEVYDRWKAGDKDYEVIQFDSIQNPAFPREEYERAKNSLPRWKFNLAYRGVFEKPAGLIYDCFDEAVCCIARFSLPQSWPRYVGHDFGPNNTAAVWYAQDPVTGWLYVYRAYLAGGLSAYDHAQRFKVLSQGETIVKRVGGAHAEQGWRDAFTAAGWPISEPRERSVEVGIDIVYGWHKRNALFVFSDLGLYLDEKLSYSRKLNENYEATDEIDDKSRYHCFVAGTMVRTILGEKPIETVQLGDLVATRQGFYPVCRSALTREAADILELTFSNGNVLRGTPEHPVWVKGKGFVRLDSVRYGDTMEIWKENKLSSKASPTTAIPMLSDVPIKCTFLAKGSGFIAPFGKTLTAPFRKAWSCITKTMIPLITSWKTLNSCPFRSTWRITPRAGSMTLSVLLEYVHSPLVGTVARRGLLGIENMVVRLSRIVFRRFMLVSSAGTRTTQLVVARGLVSARTTASQHGVEWMGEITRFVPAPFAGSNSRLIGTQGPRRAQRNVAQVSGVKPIGKARVYNLSVSQIPEFYANGILAHNCMDSERYILSDFGPERLVGSNERVKVVYH